MSNKEIGDSEKFIVAALTASTDKKYEGCLIVEYNNRIPATHKQVYGPASRKDCELWVAKNCEPTETKPEEKIRLQIKIDLTDKGEVPPLQAYAFTNEGKLLGSAPVEMQAATIEVPGSLDGHTVEIILGPRVEKDQPEPAAASLKRAGAFTKATRILAERPRLDLLVPGIYFPKWCFCVVRGRLVKRVTQPDGTILERPVCNARVHICEVDRIPWIIYRLPEIDIRRLRDDLLRRLRLFPWPPPGPEPDPRLKPLRSQADINALPDTQLQPSLASLSFSQQQSVAALSVSDSVDQLRSRLADLSSLIAIHLCDLAYLWGYFNVDCLTSVEVGHDGRFSRTIIYNCADQPDLYFWVEQFRDGAWHTVYRPSVGCHTYWNYACGTEIVINVPGAVACEEPTYDIPPGVTLFVLPYAVGSTPIWGIPPGAPAAPQGWLRADGKVDYSWYGLGLLHDAPFGGTLNFIQDDSYFIPTGGVNGIVYYRYSYRRASVTANTGADDPSWTPIMTPLARWYRLEYSDRLPTYQTYDVGPTTVGGRPGLFKFKPREPPNPGGTVVAREWLSGNLSEVAASWDTTLAAPPVSPTNLTDDAGVFQVKVEVFDPDGDQIMPGAATFRFLVRENGPTTRNTTAGEVAGGAYVFRVHVDNNNVESELPQPSIGGVSASDDCGFLRYEPGDLVHIQYLAAHRNNHAVFSFGIKRGSNPLASASTTAPYVEVAAASAPTGSATPYNKVGGNYERNFTPTELVGDCVNAAFAASLSIYGKATNGTHRLGIDASELIAFALALNEEDEPEPGG